jgi:protein-S-isoprenylcysteine O-methyltransferase Ste14
VNGPGIVLNSFFTVFILGPLLLAAAAVELKLIEEPELEKRLGDDYIKYWQQTPMFFPGLCRRQKKEK